MVTKLTIRAKERYRRELAADGGPAPTHGEAALAGGVKGEQEMAVALDSGLDDGWVPVKGYSNRRGEIDYLLLGPGGLFAVEVKYVNGTFRITRSSWRYVKYDNYGNAVEEGAVQDRGGRPPNVHLAEIERLVERDHRFHATGRRR